MRLKTKYVIIDDIKAIIFTETLQHSEFKPLGEITGAGFVSIGIKNGNPSVSVYGESISLGIKSKEKDLLPVKIALGLNF